MSEKIPPQTGLGGGLAVAAAFMIGGAMVGAAVYIAHAVIYGTEVVPFVVPARAFLFGGATIAVLAYFVGKSKSLAFQRLRDQGHAIEELEAAVAERTAELRASEERLRVQFKGLPAPTYTWQRTGDDFQLIDYNDAADSYTRGAVSEAKGSMLSEMYRNMPELIGDIRRCLDEKTGIEREMVYPYQSIGQRHLNVKYAYVPPDLVMVHTEDITERKLAEAAVKESERRYRSLYNETPVMMHSIDLSGKLLDANEYWLETLGYQREEVVGTSDMAFFTEASRKYALEVNLPAFAKNGFCRDVPYQLIKKNGEIIDVLLSAVAQKNEDGEFDRSVAVMIDVTEEKRAKAQSKSAQELLLNAIENIDEGVVLYDADDRFVLCNSQVRMHLRGLEDLLVPGTKFEDVLSAVHRNGYAEPSSGESAEELIQDALDYHANPDGSRTRRERDGRWIMINEYKTTDGGTLLVRTDITETKRREKELERAREAAETASRAKSEFLSSMSHELRTPMNAILGFAQLLNKAGERPLTDSSIRKYSGEIIKGGNHLLSLIDQVLDLAKIEAGKLSLSFESVRPADVLSECMALIGGQIGERGLILIDRTGESPMPWLWTDQARFRQVLLNLLSNAIKYNRKGGSITVTAEPQEGGFHRISVFDTGRGIPADRQSHLFEPFNRLGREAGEIEGTGIGLTISKQIVDMLGGRIGFESEEGIGSLFWIDMPIAADQFGDTDDQDDDDETEPDAAGRFSGTADQRRKVLYIEDNVSNLRLMQAVLGQMPGVSLYSAPSAEYGLDMADTEMPDLIIMDVNLPGMSGLDALLKLRASKSTRGIPVIALTEAAKPDEIEIGRKAGFKEYLTKPINIPEVLDSVRRNLN